MLCAYAALAFVGTGGVSQFAATHALMINASPSLPHWAIWVTRGTLPKKGELVVFMPPRSDLVEAHFGKSPPPFAKRVMGIAGDVVSEQDLVFAINGKPVVRAKARSHAGEALLLGPTGKIPPSCYFAASPHRDGFDSRYAAIGWVCANQIVGVGRPIL